MRIIRRFLFLVLLAFGFTAQGAVKIVATLPDLADIARQIGGDKVQVTSLAQPTEDVHFVDAKPSFIRVLNQADLLIEGGVELEIGWLPPLVDAARNKKILKGGIGRLDASEGVGLLEIAKGPIDRSQGDVHAAGNPHYLLDPRNGGVFAENITQKLIELDSSNQAVYTANLIQFREQLK